MSRIIGQNHDCVRLGPLRFWAERGFIHWEDARDNSYGTLPVRNALHRVKAINDMIGNSKKSDTRKFSASLEMYSGFVDDFVEICRKAQEQGMVTDKSARAAANRALPKSVSVPVDLQKKFNNEL